MKLPPHSKTAFLGWVFLIWLGGCMSRCDAQDTYDRDWQPVAGWTESAFSDQQYRIIQEDRPFPHDRLTGKKSSYGLVVALVHPFSQKRADRKNNIFTAT